MSAEKLSMSVLSAARSTGRFWKFELPVRPVSAALPRATTSASDMLPYPSNGLIFGPFDLAIRLPPFLVLISLIFFPQTYLIVWRGPEKKKYFQKTKDFKIQQESIGEKPISSIELENLPAKNRSRRQN